MIISSNCLLARGLTAICAAGRDFRVSAVAATVKEAEAACVRSRASVVVLDVVDRGRSGRERLLREVAETLASRYPLVFLFGKEILLSECALELPQGTRCAVAAEDAVEEWPLALAAAIRGGCHFSPSVAKRVPGPLLSRGESELPHGKCLSPREKEVVELTRAGLMPKQIARRLGRSVKTVETHYQRVKAKLGLRCIDQLRVSDEGAETVLVHR